jgi:uncharacterized repeat protein (TIGR02543 family)
LFLPARLKKLFTPHRYHLSSFFAAFLFNLVCSSIGFPAEVNLAWDPNTEPDLAGYKIYLGVQPRQYSWIMDAGNRTQATVGNLDATITYFLSITAYNAQGMESGFSNEVNYTPPTTSFSLSVHQAGTGAGTITGTGINCGTDCSETFSSVTSVSLTAASNANSTFTGWSGACSGTANPCTVNVNGSQSVTANFALKTFTLTASVGANGTISPSGSATVNYGSSQTYAINPGTGFKVANVLVDGVSVGAVTSYTFSAVTANHTISATFSARTSADGYALSVSKNGDGQGNVSNNPKGNTFKKGTKVTLTASPFSNSMFSGWSGACSGTASTCTVTMNTNQSVTASFSLKTYSITALAGSNGSITPAGITTVSYGTDQTYNINAASGYQISGVKVDGISVGAVSSYAFQNIKTNHQISASFTERTNNSPTHSLNISKKGSGKGTVRNSPEGSTFIDNTVVTVTATSDGDSTFVGWSGACVGEDPQCTIIIDHDISLTATFDAKLPSTYKNYLPIILN